MKKILIIVGFVLVSGSIVNAQGTLPTEYLLRVKPADIDKLGKALGKLPYDEAADLINSLRQQIIEQQSKSVQEPKNDPPKP